MDYRESCQSENGVLINDFDNVTLLASNTKIFLEKKNKFFAISNLLLINLEVFLEWLHRLSIKERFIS